jgi:hypothetical protein
MNKSFLPLLTLLFSTTAMFAQDPSRFFDISPATTRIQHSLYQTIGFVDSREDTSLIGLVQVGVLKNRDAILRLRSPVLPQLVKLVESLTDTTAAGGELLFQLRDFGFVQTYGTRYCRLAADLYARNGAQYTRISSMDTMMIIPGGDVSKIIQKEDNKIIADFVARGLLQQPTDSASYDLAGITNIDSIEKRRIPVYNTTSYVDGIYMNYTSFGNQLPDRQGMIDARKDGSISSVRMLDPNGNKVKLKPKNVYAIVNKGQVFIATEYGYYPMQRYNDQLIFTGDIRDVASNGDVAGGQFALGLIGAAIARSGNQNTYDMRIDHRNGRFIRLRYIPKPPTQ